MNTLQTNPASDTLQASLTPNIVSNIPVHGGPSAEADSEMDKMMHEVGQQLKKEDKKPAKKHLFFKHRNHKTEAKFSAQPLSEMPTQVLPRPEPKAEIKAEPVLKMAEPVDQADNKTNQNPKIDTKPKPQAQKSVPIFIITVAVLVTSVLIVLAVAAYKSN